MTKLSANGIEEEDWDVQEKDGEGCCRPNEFFYSNVWRREEEGGGEPEEEEEEEEALITEFLHCSWISGWNILFLRFCFKPESFVSSSLSGMPEEGTTIASFPRNKKLTPLCF